MMLLLILCLYPSNLVVTAFHHRNIQKTTIQSQPSLLSQPVRRTTNNNNARNYNTKSLTWSTSPSSSTTTLTTSLFAIPIHNIQEGTDFLFSSSSSFVDNSMAMLISSSSSAASPSLFDDIQSMNGSSVSSSSDVLGSIVIWGIRCLSAIITYFSLIYFLDRPRGELYLPVVDNRNGDDDNGNDGMLQVKQSNVENGGLGLFATQYIIPKGTILGEYPGIVVELQPHISKLNAFPQCEAYIWRFSDNKYVIDPTNSVGILDDICIGGNPNSFLSQWFFTNIINNGSNNSVNNDSNTNNSAIIGVPTTLCRINEPPKGYDVNVITIEKTNERKVIFEVERDIYPNEELFIDYGLTYDRSQYTRP